MKFERTVSGVSEAGSKTHLEDSDLVEPDDYFIGWTIEILSGNNLGQQRPIDDFTASNGSMTWLNDMPNTISTGVSYQVSSGFTFVKGNVFPQREPRRRTQEIGRAQGGQAYVVDRGVELRQYPLVFERIGQADYDNLRDFICDIAYFAKYTWTYTDNEGSTHTVRLISPDFDLEQVAYQLYSGDVLLEEEVV